MNIKVFQKNVNSDKQFIEIFEKNINEWLQENSNIKISDVQLSLSVIRRPSRKEVYANPLCLIFYERLNDLPQNPSYLVKLFADSILHNTQFERGEVIESKINAWLQENPNAKIQLSCSDSASTTWTDDNGYYWYSYHAACLIVYSTE